MTHRYEVIVPEKKEDGKVVREAVLVKFKQAVLNKPTVKGLLALYHADIIEAGVEAEDFDEVEVNITPNF